MDWTYTYNILQTKNGKVNLDRLTLDIHSSDITIALDYINSDNLNVYVIFKSEITESEKIILDNIIFNTSGELIIDISPQRVKIIEEPTPDGINITQGNYRATSIIIDIPENTGEFYKELSFPYYISIISAQWINTEENTGDEAMFVVAPDTIIGAIISNTISGETEFYVQDTVLGALNMGYYIKIGDEKLGQVYNIDKNKKKITTELETNNPHNIGTLIKMSVPIVDLYYFNGVGVIQIGNSKIGSSLIPPNTTMRMIYKNNSGTAKKFSILIDYSY